MLRFLNLDMFFTNKIFVGELVLRKKLYQLNLTNLSNVRAAYEMNDMIGTLKCILKCTTIYTRMFGKVITSFIRALSWAR